MTQIAIVDDEPRELASVGALVRAWADARDVPAAVDAFSSGSELLDAVDRRGPYTVYVLDVIMDGLNGVQVAGELRRRDADGAIVFLTTSPDYALESQPTFPLNYLLKPVSAERLHAVLDRARATSPREGDAVFRMRTSGSVVALPLGSIAYAELRGRRVRLVREDGTTLDGLTSSRAFRDRVAPLLADGRFFLCGASFAVNLANVEMVDATGAAFAGGFRVDLPKSSLGPLRRAWGSWWLGRGAR